MRLRFAIPIALLLVAATLGLSTSSCQPKPEPKKVSTEPTVEPAQKLYEQLRVGSVQADITITELEQARDILQALKANPKKDIQEAVIDLLDIIDSVARTLGDFTVVPEKSEIEKEFAVQDEHRLAGIRAFEEAQLDLGDADGVINELRSLLPDETSPQPGEVQNHFTNAGEALVDGIRGLGGNPDAPSEAEN
jgi:hypothetical protein